MPSANEIILKLKADNKQLRAGLAKGQKNVNKFANKAESRFSKLGASIGALIGAGGVFGLIRAFKALITITDKQLKAEAQLDAVLKSTKHAAGLTAEEIKNMAAELQKVTTFGDETIIAGQNLLLTFTKIGKDVFPAATETLLDMSQALGQDLKQSAILLGKALNDPIQGLTALRRVGVDLSQSNKDLIKGFVKTNQIGEAQKIILQELNTQMGGSARAARTTLGGAMTALSNRMGDVVEKAGKKLAPALMRLLKAFQQVGEGAGLFGGVMGAVGGIIGRAADSFADFINLFNIGMGKIRVEGLTDSIKILDKELGNLRQDETKNALKIRELEETRLATITRLGNAQLNNNKTQKRIEESALRQAGFKKDELKITQKINTLKDLGDKKDDKTKGKGKGGKDKGPSATDLLKFTGEQELITVHDIETKKEALIKKFSGQRVNIENAASEQIAAMQVKAFEKRFQDVNTFLGGIAGAVGQISELQDMETQGRLTKLEQERLGKQKIIEDSVADEEERNTQIEALNNEFDRKKKQVEINAAKAKKKINIFETLVAIPSAAFAAWKSAQVLPFPASMIVGASMAALATGLGFAKVDQIRKQPIPVLQQGRVPNDHSMAFIGNDEAVINAASTQANAGLLQAINQSGGQSVGGQMMQVKSVVNIDGREVGMAVNDFRQDQADDSGLTNFGEGRGAM